MCILRSSCVSEVAKGGWVHLPFHPVGWRLPWVRELRVPRATTARTLGGKRSQSELDAPRNLLFRSQDHAAGAVIKTLEGATPQRRCCSALRLLVPQLLLTHAPLLMTKWNLNSLAILHLSCRLAPLLTILWLLLLEASAMHHLPFHSVQGITVTPPMQMPCMTAAATSSRGRAQQ